MTAPHPQPQPPVSTRFLVALVAAGLVIAAAVAALALYLADQPILPPPAHAPMTFAPLPASTAAPSPLTVELTARPHTGWGPR